MFHSMYFTPESVMDTEYLNSTYFPRVVFCIVHSKEDVINDHIGTPYQCVLSANFLNEKVFIGLWVWFYLVAIINLFSLVQWTYRFMARKYFIKEILSWPYDNGYHFDKHLNLFVKNYLRTEGTNQIIIF
jgi:hypothetical protein